MKKTILAGTALALCLSASAVQPALAQTFQDTIATSDLNDSEKKYSQEEAQRAVKKIVGSLLEGSLEKFAHETTKEDKTRLLGDKSVIEKMESSTKHFFGKLWDHDYSTSLEKVVDEITLPISVTSSRPRSKEMLVALGQGSEAVNLRLVDEGKLSSDWKIDLPDSIGTPELDRIMIDEIGSRDTVASNKNREAVIEKVKALMQPFDYRKE